MKTFGFPKTSRLLTPRDYSEVFNDVQVKVPHRYFLILATHNDCGHARIGLIFSKKNLKLSVQRNRVKRLVRETFRTHDELPALDIVVLGRQGLAKVSNAELNTLLPGLWQRLRKKSDQHQRSANQPETASKGTG